MFLVVVLLTYVNKIHRPASYLEMFETVEDSCLYKRKGPPQNLYLGDTGRILEEAGMLVAQGKSTYGSSSALLNDSAFNVRSYQE